MADDLAFDASPHRPRDHKERAKSFRVFSRLPCVGKKGFALEILVELVGKFHTHIL